MSAHALKTFPQSVSKGEDMGKKDKLGQKPMAYGYCLSNIRGLEV
jgi:hypothetical protein